VEKRHCPASEDFGVQPNTCQVDNHEQCVWSSLDHVLKSYAGNVGVHMPPASDSLNCELKLKVWLAKLI